MKVEKQDPPRQFKVGMADITLSHCADIELAPDELVTFVTSAGAEYDITRKSWGYYATPSLDKRLTDNGFRAGLVRNKSSQHCFVVLVEKVHVLEWEEYNVAENLKFLGWLDELCNNICASDNLR